MINTVLVEDNYYVREVLRKMLESDGRFSPVGIFEDAFEAEKVCLQGGVKLVLMDVQTRGNHSGLAAGRRIKAAQPKTKVVIVTSLVDAEILREAKSGAADGL